MPPPWLSLIADISLALAGVRALVVLADVVAHPQKMTIMNIVWPITPLYLGPVGLRAYFSLGRRSSKGAQGVEKQKSDKKSGKSNPSWQSVFTGVTHCDAGCTLGDVLAEFGVFFLGLTLAGAAIRPVFLADFALAYVCRLP